MKRRRGFTLCHFSPYISLTTRSQDIHISGGVFRESTIRTGTLETVNFGERNFRDGPLVSTHPWTRFLNLTLQTQTPFPPSTSVASSSSPPHPHPHPHPHPLPVDGKMVFSPAVVAVWGCQRQPGLPESTPWDPVDNGRNGTCGPYDCKPTDRIDKSAKSCNMGTVGCLTCRADGEASALRYNLQGYSPDQVDPSSYPPP